MLHAGKLLRYRGSVFSGFQKGFTVVEVMAGLSVLALFAGSVSFGLMQLNNYASVNRLYTAAQTLAQNQIDLILTKAPYDPSTSSFPTPNVLQTGGYYSDPSTPNTLYGSARSVPIFTDPTTNINVVTGTIRTDITTPSVTVGGTDLNIRQATVTVQYTFHGKTYTVKMDTMRAPDV
jgi:prepilin-type N-terminal cleavage/methylation domain-containing protein